jgi:putative ABC transport system substrate-binding protein
MRRREFVSLAGAAAAWPMVAHAQQSAIPTVGFLRSTLAKPFTHLVVALREGLKDEGFIEGTSVAIEYRFADHQLERLPGLAAELVRRTVAVIVANSQAAEAAKAVTKTIPIVFVTADDPVRRGLVTRLNRPTGNATGITFFGGGSLAAKRMELLHEVVPGASIVAVLQDPSWPGSAAETPDLEATARALGKRIVFVKAASEREFGPALDAVGRSGAGALVIGGSPTFSSHRHTLVALVARRRLPAIYDLRDHVAAGGLMSYSGSLAGAYRQAGAYAGRILKGAKPADLPVLQPTTFQLVVNLKTAKALGITIPQSILVRADEVIE